MNKRPEDIAEHLLDRKWESLDDAEKKVVEEFVDRKPLNHRVSNHMGKVSTGDAIADRVASFGGSWTFIIIFFIILMLWTTLNTIFAFVITFDPYPFIFLNLVLSMLAAVQAPIIMMSQNRQAAKDRMEAEHDYEVNLRAELEIIALNHKLEDLREKKWIELIEIQQQQIALLEKIVADRS